MARVVHGLREPVRAGAVLGDDGLVVDLEPGGEQSGLQFVGVWR